MSLKIPLLPLLSNFHILSRRLLRFLLEAVQQDHAIPFRGAREYPVDITCVFGSELPKVFAAAHLLPELRWHDGKRSQQFQRSHHFRARRGLQIAQEFLNRLLPGIGCVEDDLAHAAPLA